MSILQIMGICQFKDNNIVYTTKSLMDKTSDNHNTHFYFSTQPLSKLDGDFLLILLADINLKKNKFVANITNKAINQKIYNSYHTVCNSKPIVGQLHFLNTVVPQLQYNKIGFIYLPQIEYQQYQSDTRDPTNNKIKSMLQGNFDKISRQGIRSIVITELEWKSWINKNNGFKLICETITNVNKFKSVVFACLSQEAQVLFMKIVQERINNMKRSN